MITPENAPVWGVWTQIIYDLLTLGLVVIGGWSLFQGNQATRRTLAVSEKTLSLATAGTELEIRPDISLGNVSIEEMDPHQHNPVYNVRIGTVKNTGKGPILNMIVRMIGTTGPAPLVRNELEACVPNLGPGEGQSIDCFYTLNFSTAEPISSGAYQSVLVISCKGKDIAGRELEWWYSLHIKTNARTPAAIYNSKRPEWQGAETPDNAVTPALSE